MLAALVTVASGYLNTHLPLLKEAGATAKQITSWVVSIALVFIGQVKSVGIVAELNTLWTVINGIAVGLVANGVFDITLVQSILTFLKANKASTDGKA